MAYPYVSDHEVRVLSKHFGDPSHRRIDTYVERGGYKALKKAFEMGPAQVIDEVKVRSPGPWWCWIPDRSQMVVYAPRLRKAALSIM